MSSDYCVSIFRFLAEVIFQKHPEIYQKLQECLEKLILSRTSQNDIRNTHGDLEALSFTLNIFKLMEEFDKYIIKFKQSLSNADPFDINHNFRNGTNFGLIHLQNRTIIPEDIQNNILHTERRGEIAYQTFVVVTLSGTKWQRSRCWNGLHQRNL